MNKKILGNYKILLVSISMLLFSLSCDDQIPVAAEAPALDYTITIVSEVENPLTVGQIIMCFGGNGCSEFNEDECEDQQDGLDCTWGEPTNIAYSAGAKNIEDVEVLTDRGYHLFFEFKLRDIDGEPVEGASLVAIEDYLGEGAQQGEFKAFQDNDETNSSGIINGYWEDNGQSGDFIITVKYTDENGKEIEETLHGMSARIFMHENEHMNGYVFTELVSKMKLDRAKKAQKKLIKETVRRQNR